MPAQLVALSEGPSILLDKPIMLFGRNPECDIQIDSRKVSRRHCCVAQVNDYLVVRDLGSTNGIRINGVRLLEGKLHHGDELTIGSHRYKISWEDGDAALGNRGIPASEAIPAGGTVPEPEEDDILEECDEPIPLPEPGAQRGRGPGKTAVGNDKDARRPRPPSPKSSKSGVLPENLDLAPSEVHHTERAASDSVS
jgi:predicted component of type VI protein secretion system